MLAAGVLVVLGPAPEGMTGLEVGTTTMELLEGVGVWMMGVEEGLLESVSSSSIILATHRETVRKDIPLVALGDGRGDQGPGDGVGHAVGDGDGGDLQMRD